MARRGLKLTVKIDSKDDAATENPIGEAKRALRSVLTHLEGADHGTIAGGALFDTNGNKMGTWEFQA